MAYTDHNRFPSFKILLVFLCLTLVGIFLIPELPVKLAPKKEMPTLSVSFSMRNMTSRVVEMEVTSKLEAMLSRVKGVQHVNSSSGNGWGSIYVEMNKNTDIDVARFEISSLIRQVYPTLPEGVSYPYISARRSDDKSSRPFLTFILNAPSSPVLIQEYAENNLKNKISYLDGIDEVEISGASPMIWKLEYDYTQLQKLNITVNDIQRSINKYLNKESLGVGYMETGGNEKRWIRLSINPEFLPDKFDVSKIYVSNNAGKLIRLDELVTVTFTEDEPSSYFRINGLNSIYLNIKAKENANQLRLAKSVKSLIKSVETQLPPNYEINPAYDATEYIQDQIKTILFRSGLTLLILLAFVLLIYRNGRYLLMIAVSLLCNLALAVVFYYLLKLEIHLYSLMGITISLSLMLDNIIVMSDQIHRQKNKKAFLAILTSTLTTIAALVMIFFMEEQIRLNLLDFAIVIMINLGVSLLVVMLLVPALMEKLHLDKRNKMQSMRQKRINIRFNRFYNKFLRFSIKRRWLVLLIGLLMFGLPVFMLPSKIEQKDNVETGLTSDESGLSQKEPGILSKVYNATLGSDFYNEKLKSIVDVALGGTLRLFITKVYEGSYWKSNEETSLYVTLSMPNGTTLAQTNHLITRMEDYLRKFKEIKQFQTNVNTLRASIDIRFTKDNQYSSFPYMLKGELISKAIELGGGGWGVYGLGDGFSNNMSENAGSYRIKMLGYNYDELWSLAEVVKNDLLGHRRIKEVSINSEFNWYKSDYQEFVFNLDKEKLIQSQFEPLPLFDDINQKFTRNQYAGYWVNKNGNNPIRLFSKQSEDYDVWQLNNFPNQINNQNYRISGVASIEKYQAPQEIAREDQQYRLCLQYEYIGASEQGSRVLDKTVDKMKEVLPLGYSIERDESYGWNNKGKYKQYLLLLIVVIIIYFTTSILFNSLRQPLAILLMIPISYVGLFLTFYLFHLNFDQGGFAAFVLLSGITVNAGIYMVNQYNLILKSVALVQSNSGSNIFRGAPADRLKTYIKAWNLRVIPVFLTLLSTILGFVPFLIGEKEGFWFPLAAGTIGGLVMSIVGLFVFLPLLLGIGKREK